MTDGFVVRDHRCGQSITRLAEEMMRRISTKVLCATVVATFVCTACHADGLTKDDVRVLLEANNKTLTDAMREHAEALSKSISEGNHELMRTISDGDAALGKNLSEAIDRLGTRLPSPNPNSTSIAVPPPPPPPPPIYVHKTVRHIYIHKYVFCCRVVWEEDPCRWRW
jgi:hypothetical protein